MVQDEITRYGERSEGLFLGHRREVVQELVNGYSLFQVVKERPDRYARTAEDGCASGDFRVAVDDGV